MKLWAEVLTPDGTNKLGVLKLVSCAVERRLDGAGRIEIVVPAGDLHAVSLLQIRRRVHLYTDNPIGKRLIVRGILMRPSWRPEQESSVVTWEGEDELSELKNINTLRGMYFESDSAADIVRNLIGRVSGWGVKVEANLENLITTQKYDALSILKALSKLMETTGLHMRLGPEEVAQYLTVGTFGEDAGLRLTNTGRVHPIHVIGARDIGYLERIEIVQDGFNVVNWIEPLGGNGDYPLTLKRANKSSPYVVENTVASDGRKAYYLKDAASIAKYGMIQKVMQLTGAVPVTADTTSLILPANVLYDWGVVQLQRLKDPQWVYRATGVKIDKKIYAGQQVRLAYAGYAYHGQIPVRYVDIDEMVYVTKISEAYGPEGINTSFEISNKNNIYKSVAETIAESIRKQEDIILSTRLVQRPRNYSITKVISNEVIYTGDLCVEGKVEFSSEDVSYPAINAFDNNTATDWRSAATNVTHSIAYQMTAQNTVKRYTIRASATENGQAPRWWKLRYFDGDAYQTADERASQTAWSAGEVRTFEVAGDFTSSKWQLEIYTYGTLHYVAIAEIEMFAISSAPIELAFTIPQYVIDLGRFQLYVTRADVSGPQGFTVRLATAGILDGPWNIDGGPFLETPDEGSTFSVSLEDVSPVIAGDHTVYVECVAGIGEVEVVVKTIEATIAIS